MGLISSGDEFCARSDRALAEIPGVFKLADDILVHGENYVELLERIKTVFAQCEEYGIRYQKTNTNLDQLLNSLATSLAKKDQK